MCTFLGLHAQWNFSVLIPYHNTYLFFMLTTFVMKKICIDAKCTNNWSIRHDINSNFCFIIWHQIFIFTMDKIVFVVYRNIVTRFNTFWSFQCIWTIWLRSCSVVVFARCKWVGLTSLKQKKNRNREMNWICRSTWLSVNYLQYSKHKIHQ